MFFAFSGSFPPLPSLVPFHDFYSSPFSNLPSFFCFSLTPFVSPSSFFSIPYLSPFLPLFLPFFPSFPSFIHPLPPLQTLSTFLPSIHSSSLPSLPPFLHASVYLLWVPFSPYLFIVTHSVAFACEAVISTALMTPTRVNYRSHKCCWRSSSQCPGSLFP